MWRTRAKQSQDLSHKPKFLKLVAVAALSWVWSATSRGTQISMASKIYLHVLNVTSLAPECLLKNFHEPIARRLRHH